MNAIHTSLVFSSRVMIILAVMISVGRVHADVVAGDWKTDGDGLLTRDLDNRLEWLDLRQTMSGTLNRSYNDVIGQLGVGGDFEGFRHANESELLALWTSAGIPDINVLSTTENFQPVSDLILLMDNTSPNPTTSQFTYGILADSNLSGTHQAAMIDITSPITGRSRSNVRDVLDSATNISGGHYLVRVTAIPEPSSLILMILLGIPCGVRMRRRTN